MMVSGSGVRQVSRFLLGGFGRLRRAVFEAEAVVAGFEDVAAMGETVEQRRGHFRIAEDGGPFAEAQVRCDDDAGSLVEFAEQMEEQRSAGGAERQVAKLVEDDEVGIGEPAGDLSWLSLKLLSFEGVDQFDRREEPDALAVVFDSLNADGRRKVGLARAGAANQNYIVGVLQELAAVKLADERLVDFATDEVEPGEIAIVREARGFELVGG